MATDETTRERVLGLIVSAGPVTAAVGKAAVEVAKRR